MVRNAAIAEELAQDAFGKAFISLESFRGDASPRTWLLAIARNRCLDHLRRHQRTRQIVTTDSEASDDAASDAPLPGELLSNRDDVARALDSLDETQRALIVLRFRHGLSYDELAMAFGIKPGTARMRVSRALARMRQTLQTAPEPGSSRDRAGTLRSAMSPQRKRAMPPAGPPAMPSVPPSSAPSIARAAPAPRHLSGGRFADVLGVAIEPISAQFRDRLASLLRAI